MYKATISLEDYDRLLKIFKERKKNEKISTQIRS